jgi:hypothetical protein
MKPIADLWTRVEVAKQDSDTATFMSLLYLGEALLKTVTAATIASLDEDADRHRYRLVHRLVRADGIGEWLSALEDALKGPASQKLSAGARESQRELTERVSDGWRRDALTELYEGAHQVGVDTDQLPAKSELLRWFALFVQLRNATRGHGATLSTACSRAVPHLERSLRLLTDNLSAIRLPWAFLYRNLSGRYRVTKLSDTAAAFDKLKSSGDHGVFPNGMYVHVDVPRHVELVHSDSDAQDFFFANGNFRGKSSEFLSYLTDTRVDRDATAYLRPATELPASETEGLQELDAQGEALGNLPPTRPDYVSRPGLEAELLKLLEDDRHPVVTLAGRGGIGKTSLALTVLHRLATSGRFVAIVWLSARDIDLMPTGPKPVRPAVMTIGDIAAVFSRCVSRPATGKAAEKVLADYLSGSPDGPFLIVVDNFETLRNPLEVFTWLDTYVRLPTKVLITTRSREFKGDYPLDVGGMTEGEADQLVSRIAANLGIDTMITGDYRAAMYREAEGHPYITRVLLGEVAKAGRLVKIERLVAGRDEMLDALFERTFAGLSPAARHIFLLLAAWRSIVPEIALAAVLLRPQNERIDVDSALAELVRMSLIEELRSETDDSYFYSVPLAASVFGRRKLVAAAEKTAVEADLDLVKLFGAAESASVRGGIAPRIEKVFRYYSYRLQNDPKLFSEARPMLEFIASRFPPAWNTLARLDEEAGMLAEAKQSYRRYLESGLDPAERQRVWRELVGLSRRTKDALGIAQALSESAVMGNISLNQLTRAAQELLDVFQQGRELIPTEQRRVLLRPIIAELEARLRDASPTDLSRLAWLLLHSDDEGRAADVVRDGLRRDPDNYHLLKLADRLGIGPEGLNEP